MVQSFIYRSTTVPTFGWTPGVDDQEHPPGGRL